MNDAGVTAPAGTCGARGAQRSRGRELGPALPQLDWHVLRRWKAVRARDEGQPPLASEQRRGVVGSSAGGWTFNP